MPREGKTSITVKEETFDALRDAKPEGVTWDYYLMSLLDGAE